MLQCEFPRPLWLLAGLCKTSVGPCALPTVNRHLRFHRGASKDCLVGDGCIHAMCPEQYSSPNFLLLCELPTAYALLDISLLHTFCDSGNYYIRTAVVYNRVKLCSRKEKTVPFNILLLFPPWGKKKKCAYNIPIITHRTCIYARETFQSCIDACMHINLWH